MGYTAKRKHVAKDGKERTTYLGRHRADDGHMVSRSFAKDSDARRWVALQEGDKARGDWVDPRSGQVTLRAYAEAWREIQVHRRSTGAQVETNLRLHLYPQLGDRALASLRPSEVQAWVKGLSVVLAPATVELVYRYLVAIYRAATADQIVSRSPCVGVKLPKVEPVKVEPLALEVVQALTGRIGPRYRALVTLGAGTGLRQGEAFGLTLDNLDFLRRQLVVCQQLVLVAGSPPYLGPPKTEKSYRTVPLPATVVDELAAHLKRWPAVEQPVLRQRPSGELVESSAAFVFTADNGRPIRRNRFGDVWRPAARAAGVAEGGGYHELRHFYASLLIRHGESVKVVQSRLGHASAMETLDTYGHLWPDSDDRTREAVDLVLGAADGAEEEAQ
jgi:integrase